MKKGKLFVLSAPSGGGKTTVARELLNRVENLEYSISVTTRPMRPGEVNGQDYFFVSVDEFKEMQEQDAFLESALVHKNYYGTKLSFVKEKTEAGISLVMDIDVVGALNIKRILPDSVLIFILPPSEDELERRLRDRATDSDEVIALRLKNSLEEMTYQYQYEYVVINDKIEECVDDVEAIIYGEIEGFTFEE